MRTLRERRLLVHGALHAAAVTIAHWAKARFTRWKFLKFLETIQARRRWEAAIVIQRFVRGWPKWNRFQRYLREKQQAFLHFAATQMQKIIRGFIARRAFWRENKGKVDDRLDREREVSTSYFPFSLVVCPCLTLRGFTLWDDYWCVSGAWW